MAFVKMKRDEFYQMFATTTIGVLAIVFGYAAIRGELTWPVIGFVVLWQVCSVVMTMGLSLMAK